MGKQNIDNFLEKTDHQSSVYTVPSSVWFLKALAGGIVDRIRKVSGENIHPHLATTTILLPTRRACRSLQQAFLQTGQGRAMILPRMIPIGDIDEGALTLQDDGFTITAGDGDTTGIPPAISATRRQLLLARLIQARQDTAPDQALKLARELALLLDHIHTERLDLADLKTLVPEDFARHWQITLEFLEILSLHWPEILKEQQAVDPAFRRDALISKQAELWKTAPPAGHVIAAGSTGSIPATADLLSVIANMDKGAVILPGLDRQMPDDMWQRLKPHHPQFGLSQLLQHLQVERQHVRDWQTPQPSTPALVRARIVNQSLWPLAGSEETNAHDDTDIKDAFKNVVPIVAQSPLEEASAIAMIMREVLETPGKTAALVTPDRNLARRTRAQLERFGVNVDDSGGTPLGQTPVGTFFRLSARMVADRFEPVAMLAALKHPLAQGGLGSGEFKRQLRQLEIAILRGPKPGSGITGLRRALDPKQTGLHGFLDRLQQMTTEFSDLMQQKTAPLADLIRAHVRIFENLSATAEETGAARLWRGEAGEVLSGFIHEVSEDAGIMNTVNVRHYPALMETLMSGRMVRPAFGTHPRLHIWGLMEARLQQADVMILGSLNEGSWPPDAQANPWMSRPMLHDFGLPQPERRIGLTAHDFVQALSAKNIFLTRSDRIEGTPSQPSRWLLRLENKLASLGQQQLLQPEQTYLSWAEQLDRPDRYAPSPPPAPKPALDLRPSRLSVSRIETWIRDPYALYAERILKLRPLDPLNADPGAAERGTIIHTILENFLTRYPDRLPENAEQALLDIGAGEFESHLSRPGVKAFWWPRFKRIAKWFAAFEHENRRAGATPVAVETSGKMNIEYGAGMPFTLTAKVDRIDRVPDGSLRVIDYKTGSPPTVKQVEAGLTPQLSLEAAMIKAGAFKNIDPVSPVSALVYIQLSGGRRAGVEKPLKLDAETVAEKALNGLTRRIRAYASVNTPYLSNPRPMFESRFGDFNHLARTREWQSGGGDDQ